MCEKVQDVELDTIEDLAGFAFAIAVNRKVKQDVITDELARAILADADEVFDNMRDGQGVEVDPKTGDFTFVDRDTGEGDGI